MSTTQDLGLQLATPEGLVTRSQQGDRNSMLDLTFLPQDLYGRLHTCTAWDKACFGSNHRPIQMILDAATPHNK